MGTILNFKLSLALNFSVFQYEVMLDLAGARTIALTAIEKVFERIAELRNEEDFNDVKMLIE